MGFKCDLFYGDLMALFERDGFPSKTSRGHPERRSRTYQMQRLASMVVLSLLMKRWKQRFYKTGHVCTMCTTGFVMKALGLAEATVKRILLDLRKAGYIQWDEERRANGWRAPRMIWPKSHEIVALIRKPMRGRLQG